MKFKQWVKQLGLVSALLLSTNAQSAILTLDPFNSTIEQGETIDLNLRVWGLMPTQDIAFWSVDLGYDLSVFSFDSAVTGDELGNPATPFTPFGFPAGFVDTGSNLTLAETSSLLDLSSQADNFILATLTFSGVAPGTATFALDSLSAIFMDSLGGAINIDSALSGSGTVNPVTAVPVPGAVWLLGSALLGFTGIRSRLKASA